MAFQFREDFSEYPNDATFSDGDTFGPWNVVFAGFGQVDVSNAYVGTPVLHLVPTVATDESLTHSALVIGPAVPELFSYRCRIQTLSQSREGSDPHNWEVAWVIWNYRNDNGFHEFHYLALKPTGWELGQASRAFPDNGNQNFIAGSDHFEYPINRWYEVLIQQSATQIAVVIDGELVAEVQAEIVQELRPFGIYTEDASILYTDILVEYE